MPNIIRVPGGGQTKIPSDLSPLCPNFTVERNGGKVKISADKIQLNSYTNMVAGGVWAWGKTRPTKPTGENTKQWSRADLVPDDPALATQGISTMAVAGTPVQLKDIPVSTAGSAVTLKIPETADTYEEYLYGFKNYEGSNAGALVRKNIFDKENYSSTSSLFVNYGGSTLDTSLVDFANNNLDESVKKYLVEVQVQARGGPYPRSCFALSDDELGAPKVSPVYGTAFPYFSSNEARIAQYAGAASSYWGRDTSGVGTGSTGVMINESGVPTVIYAANALNGIRPTIAVSLDAWFVKNDDGTYTFAGDEPTPTEHPLEIEIDWPESDPLIARQWVYNEKGVYQTMLLGGIASTEDAPPFKLPEFTGNHAIFGDEIAGRIELYESGELTLSPGAYDVFLVGGGSGAPYTPSDSSLVGGSGGGAGGFTYTEKGFVVERESAINVVVGAGGTSGTAGFPSTVDLISKILTANGGTDESAPAWNGKTDYKHTNGFNGGSGGGARSGQESSRGDGGSDGGNGVSSTQGRIRSYAGTGQGKTTRAFEEPEMTLYAGGGGGGAYPGATPGKGGAGGGGDGASNGTGKSGTPNTGGGGGSSGKGYGGIAGAAGGSGIVIVRWNNA